MLVLWVRMFLFLNFAYVLHLAQLLEHHIPVIRRGDVLIALLVIRSTLRPRLVTEPVDLLEEIMSSIRQLRRTFGERQIGETASKRTQCIPNEPPRPPRPAA
jgi:hypothetical protein